MLPQFPSRTEPLTFRACLLIFRPVSAPWQRSLVWFGLLNITATFMTLITGQNSFISEQFVKETYLLMYCHSYQNGSHFPVQQVQMYYGSATGGWRFRIHDPRAVCSGPESAIHSLQ